MRSTLDSIITGLFQPEDSPDATAHLQDQQFEKAREQLSDSWPVRDENVRAAAQALDDNRLDDAKQAAEGILSQHLNNADALNLVAQIAHCEGHDLEAERHFSRCVALAPDNQAYRYNYAILLSHCAQVDTALSETQILLEKQPGNLLFRHLHAGLLCKKKHFADASVCYRELTEEYPDSPELWCRLGGTLRSLGGHTQEAIDAFRKAVELAPWLGSAWWALASIRTFDFTETDARAMEAQLSLPPPFNEQRSDMYFALGKAHEDLGNYEKSFRHYTRGNAIRRVDLRYDPEDTTAMVSRARAVFTRELFEEKSDSANASKEPIFVLGLQRAGSTLVEQILSSHSQVEGAGELQALLRLVKDEVMPKTGPDYPNGMEQLSAGDLRDMGEKYLQFARLHRRLDRPFFVDKCNYNLWHVGLIHLIFPNAKIVDVRRHPVACCYANFTMSFAHAPPLSYRLTDIGRFYRDYVRLMAHFDRVLPGKIHKVIYEELVGDLEGEVRRLLDFVGLAFETACLEYYKNDRAFNSFSNEQVRRPIFTNSVERWRSYEPWLGPLKAVLGSVLDAYPDVPEFQS